jgi:hypothetical protein
MVRCRSDHAQLSVLRVWHQLAGDLYHFSSHVTYALQQACKPTLAADVRWLCVLVVTHAARAIQLLRQMLTSCWWMQ